MQAPQLQLHAAAEFQVECGERLVEQQRARPVHQRARQRHALLLPAGQLRGVARAETFHADQREGVVDDPRQTGAVQAVAARPEGDVRRHRQMREQRVVLKDRVDRAAVGRRAGHVPAADPDLAARGLHEAGDDPQQRRLAAAARPQQRHELAFGDIDRDIRQRGNRAVALLQVADLDERFPRHRRPCYLPATTRLNSCVMRARSALTVAQSVSARLATEPSAPHGRR